MNILSNHNYVPPPPQPRGGGYNAFGADPVGVGIRVRVRIGSCLHSITWTQQVAFDQTCIIGSGEELVRFR